MHSASAQGRRAAADGNAGRSASGLVTTARDTVPGAQVVGATTPRLLQPGTIGRMKMRNRIVMAPMGTNYGTSDGLASVRDQLYYAERARGGAAMIITEAMSISAQARNHTHSLGVYHDRFIPGLAEIVSAVHEHGAVAVGQLNHRGGLLRRSVLDMEPVGPSPWANPNTGDAVRPLTVEEIRAIQQDFLDAGRRLWRAGYDGVEIHAANGYLFQQFFSRRINHRIDQYGGSFENRSRFLRETVRRIRDALPDLTVLVRISVVEHAPEGYTAEEAAELAKALEDEGVAALDLSSGTNEHPDLSRFCIQPPSVPRRYLARHSGPVKAAVDIPVILAGRIIDPEDVETLLAADACDFVALGRALLADAYWVRKASGEFPTPIRKCISCNVCFERLTTEQDVACLQNPLAGSRFEAIESAEPQVARRPLPGNPRRVLVLGAGVAGVEAARHLAAQGHEVEVWERAEKPGGQLLLALVPPHKEEVQGVWTYRWQQLQSLGVPVRLGVTATPEAIGKFTPDEVVVATGARPVRPALFADAGVPCLTAWEVLEDPGRIPPGSRVTIVGGGLVGVETAELLTTLGCRITILEMLPRIAATMPRNNRADLLLRLAGAGVDMVADARVERVEGAALHLTVKGEERTHDAGDFLVLAMGVRPERSVLPMLEELGLPHVLVGDCNQPGDFLTAIRDAWLTAMALPRQGGSASH